MLVRVKLLRSRPIDRMWKSIRQIERSAKPGRSYPAFRVYLHATECASNSAVERLAFPK